MLRVHLTRIEQSYYSVQVAIDHVTLPVRDYEAGKRFYEEALRPLGLAPQLDWPHGRRAWFGIEGTPATLWLVESEAAGSLELCLGAELPGVVDAFHAVALGVGGRSKWEPGIRPEFSRDYYAARIEDPDGNSIEVVCRGEAAVSAIDRSVAA
jgi:catechol 2,3-dioxygenase-like lactoylglutathione lyase family enzyme